MEYGAIDLHKKESQVRIITETGDMIDRRVPTTRDRFTAIFWGRPRMRILLKPPRKVNGSRNISRASDVRPAQSTGKNRSPGGSGRDRSLSTRYLPRGTPALSAAAKRAGATQCAPGIGAGADARNLIGTGDDARRWIARPERPNRDVLTRLDALDLPPLMKATLLPLRSVIEVLDDELASADDQFGAMVADDPVVKRLTTLPSIGPITASAYVAALDDVHRFDGAGQVTSYLGLVPREYSSGEQQRRGRILRSAHPQVQSLLVQAAWRMSRSSSPDTAALRGWAQAIARRRGKKVAMVALARRAFSLRCGETRPSIRPLESEQSNPSHSRST